MSSVAAKPESSHILRTFWLFSTMSLSSSCSFLCLYSDSHFQVHVRVVHVRVVRVRVVHVHVHVDVDGQFADWQLLC